MSQPHRFTGSEEERRAQARRTVIAGDDHGRRLTTSPTAAEWYRVAQQRAGSADGPDLALRLAVRADPLFAVAAADIRALSGAPGPRAPDRAPRAPLTTWERHHCEVVAVAGRNASLAAGLLREHLTEVGCDPLALRIVADALRAAGRAADLDDLAASAPLCHGDAMPAIPGATEAREAHTGAD